jgi:hypothetical protein
MAILLLQLLALDHCRLNAKPSALFRQTTCGMTRRRRAVKRGVDWRSICAVFAAPSLTMLLPIRHPKTGLTE